MNEQISVNGFLNTDYRTIYDHLSAHLSVNTLRPLPNNYPQTPPTRNKQTRSKVFKEHCIARTMLTHRQLRYILK